jgi:hypothetical protein
MLHGRLSELNNECWKKGYVPEEWNMAVVIPILLFKKGMRRGCSRL